MRRKLSYPLPTVGAMAVSPEHQIYSELFADTPDMAVGFLRKLGLHVPDYEHSEVTSCDLGHIDPVERRSDVAILLRGPDPAGPPEKVMGIVVEVQRDKKDRKRFTWPEYVSALRSKHECPVVLLAICPRQEVADWYGAPIALGHPGFVLNPVVLGPEGIPVVKTPEEVGQRPTLGVLSAAAHGNRHREVLDALHSGLALIDEEKAAQYIGYALHLLSETGGQQALEELMMTDTFEYTSTWADSLRAEGEAKGKAEGEAKALLRILRRRGIAVDEAARERITACRDLDQLDHWFDRAFDIDHTDDLFTD